MLELPIKLSDASKGQAFLDTIKEILNASVDFKKSVGTKKINNADFIRKIQMRIEALIEALVKQQKDDIENNLLLLWLKKFLIVISNYQKLKYKPANPPFYLKLIEEIMSLLSHILAITGRKLDKVFQLYLLNDVLARFTILMQDVNGIEPKGYGNPIKLIFIAVSKSLNVLIDKAHGRETNAVVGNRISVPSLQELKPQSKASIDLGAEGIMKGNSQLATGIEIKIGQGNKAANKVMDKNQETQGQPAQKINEGPTNHKENKPEAKDKQDIAVKPNPKINVSQKEDNKDKKNQSENAKSEPQHQRSNENVQDDIAMRKKMCMDLDDIAPPTDSGRGNADIKKPSPTPPNNSSNDDRGPPSKS